MPDDNTMPEHMAMSQRSSFEDYGVDHLEQSPDPILVVKSLTTHYTMIDEVPEPLFLFRFNPGTDADTGMFFGLPFGFMDDFVEMVAGAWEDYQQQFEQEDDDAVED